MIFRESETFQWFIELFCNNGELTAIEGNVARQIILREAFLITAMCLVREHSLCRAGENIPTS